MVSITSLFIAIYLPLEAFALNLPNQECIQKSHRSGWSSLKQIAIMPIDERYGLSEGASKVGVSDAESKWLRRVSGDVVCRDPKLKKLAMASGTIFEKSDQIVTNAHVFFSEGELRKECYFLTKTDPPVRRKLLVESTKSKFGTRDVSRYRELDYAIVKLDSAIPGVKPVKRRANIESVGVGDEIVIVSAQMTRMTRSLTGNEPVVQKCRVRDMIRQKSFGASSIYTDCSTTEGSSGSINLTRDEKGELAAVGISRGAASADNDYQPYDFESRNASRSLIFDGEFAAALDEKPASK